MWFYINELIIDDEYLDKAAAELGACATEMEVLSKRIKLCFNSLRVDWDTDAGKAFFSSLDNGLLFHIENHMKVLRHMSTNLKTSSNKYDEVFRAVENAAEAEYRQY
jgi:uncharacterized protein YukE